MTSLILRQKISAMRNDILSRFSLSLARPDIVGVGIGQKIVAGVPTDELCIKYLVRNKVPEEYLLPSEVIPKFQRVGPSSFLTDVDEGLNPKAPLTDPYPLSALLSRQEPTPPKVLSGGLSAAHFRARYGTLGCCYRSAESHRINLFVSCNHVLAAYNSAHIGDAVISPALAQVGASPQVHVGGVSNYIKLKFGGVNRFDVAVARATDSFDCSEEIIGFAFVKNPVACSEILPGDTVFKSGSASGRTAGRVVAICAAVKVDYWPLGVIGKNTIFLDQIVTSSMGMLGDSGAVLVNDNNEKVGLLFAGTAAHTYFNDLQLALRALNMSYI
jgi:hypothetical protein